MEAVGCGLCGAKEYRTHLVGRDLRLHVAGTFRIVECLTCGLLYLNPRPTRKEVEAYYPFERYDQYNPALPDVKSWLLRTDRAYGLRKRGKRVTEWKVSGRLLDVGCATGDFLEYMRRLGNWEVCGVELNPFAARYVRERLHIPVYEGMLDETDLPSAYFDVVTMWHVLEHVFDPVATLGRIAQILKRDGVFIYHVPQLDSWDAKLYGRYWSGYEIPRHTYIWSRGTLQRLMDVTGFRVLETACFYGSYAQSASSVRFWMRDKLGHAGIRRLLERLLFTRPMRVAFLPLFFVLDRLQKSSSLTVVCAPAGKGEVGDSAEVGTVEQ